MASPGLVSGSIRSLGFSEAWASCCWPADLLLALLLAWLRRALFAPPLAGLRRIGLLPPRGCSDDSVAAGRADLYPLWLLVGSMLYHLWKTRRGHRPFMSWEDLPSRRPRIFAAGLRPSACPPSDFGLDCRVFSGPTMVIHCLRLAAWPGVGSLLSSASAQYSTRSPAFSPSRAGSNVYAAENSPGHAFSGFRLSNKRGDQQAPAVAAGPATSRAAAQNPGLPPAP